MAHASHRTWSHKGGVKHEGVFLLWPIRSPMISEQNAAFLPQRSCTRAQGVRTPIELQPNMNERMAASPASD